MLIAGAAPLSPYKSMQTPWLCRCLKCGREITPRLDSIRRGQTACAYCAGKRIDPIEAVEIMRKAGVEPHGDYPGNAVPWPSTCHSCARQVAPRLANVRISGKACAYCSKSRIDESDAIAHMIDAGLEPLEPYPGTMLPWRCRCMTCGATVTPRHNGIRSGQGGCLACGNKSSSKTRLITASVAEQIMRDHQLEPLEPYLHSKAPWRCRCMKCGKEVAPRLNTVSTRGAGCAYCAGNRVDESDANALMQLAGFQPLEPYKASGEKWRCRCMTCGLESTPTYANVRMGSRCVNCTDYGFHADEPAGFYAVRNELILKCGISNNPEQRLKDHRRQGLDQLIGCINFEIGSNAVILERAWMSYIQERSTERGRAVKKSELKDGHTEALKVDPAALRFVEDLFIQVGVTLRSTDEG